MFSDAGLRIICCFMESILEHWKLEFISIDHFRAIKKSHSFVNDPCSAIFACVFELKTNSYIISLWT